MKAKLVVIALAGYLFTVGVCFGQTDNALKYIKENAIPIDTNADNTDLKDLSYLKSTLEGRRIIGMGEATHGTQEFQVAKFRVFKYLVTQMGYKLFGIEANFTECRRVNDYILYEKGDSKKAIAGMYFWTWNTTEMQKIVEWMHDYNVSKPAEQKVKFYGFDMQYDSYAIQQITEKFKKLDSVYFNANFNRLNNLHMINKGGVYVAFTKNQRDSISLLIDNLSNYVDNQGNNFLRIYSKDELAFLKRDIRLLKQCFDENQQAVKYGQGTVNTSNIRDQYMAENVEWILSHEGPESKIMLWAHNGHVCKNGPYRSMGYHLKAKFKEQYYVIGFDFNKGSFRAVDTKDYKLKSFTVPDAKEGSSGFFFSSLRLPEFFIDMEKVVKTNSSAKSFFTQRITQRSTGAVFNMDKEKNTYLKDPLYSYFDGLIFVNETTATLALK